MKPEAARGLLKRCESLLISHLNGDKDAWVRFEALDMILHCNLCCSTEVTREDIEAMDEWKRVFKLLESILGKSKK